MWCFGEGISWGSWFGGFWMLLFGGGLTALIVWGVTRVNKVTTPVSKRNSLDIAKERYARGDIKMICPNY